VGHAHALALPCAFLATEVEQMVAGRENAPHSCPALHNFATLNRPGVPGFPVFPVFPVPTIQIAILGGIFNFMVNCFARGIWSEFNISAFNIVCAASMAH